MRFYLGPVPDEFTPDASWRSIREPGPTGMQLFATPIGVGLALLTGLCWLRVGATPAALFADGLPVPSFFVLLAALSLLIVVHELIHAFVHPRAGRSPATIIGFWPKQVLFYAHYSGPLTRNRFLAILTMPFVVITLVPLALAAAIPLSPTAIIVAAWFSTWNALFACGDLFGLALILFQVPRGADIQNQGWRTYWKMA